MTLDVRQEPKTVPDYSLTGDLLSYLRCGLQYRYQNGSSLPPARPVQLWFGEFIHGVMEMAYTMWKEHDLPLPWPYTPIAWENRETGLGLPDHDIGEIGRRIEAVLAVQGKIARSSDARAMAYARAAAAVNLVGPALFPLVAFAEEPLAGSRPLPNPTGALLRSERYGVTGVADVLTSITLSQVPESNLIRAAVTKALAEAGVPIPPEFEVIVDYKGASRPDVGTGRQDYWQQHDWQIQMYAWLRGRKPEAKPVVAGIVIYVNELLPGVADAAKLRTQVSSGRTDVAPVRGSADDYVLNMARPGTRPGGEFTEAFRLQRALRVIPVTEQSKLAAGAEFDDVVGEIEGRIAHEIDQGDISRAWVPTCGDEETCSACDFRYFCPKPFGHDSDYTVSAPPVP